MLKWSRTLTISTLASPSLRFTTDVDSRWDFPTPEMVLGSDVKRLYACHMRHIHSIIHTNKAPCTLDILDRCYFCSTLRIKTSHWSEFWNALWQLLSSGILPGITYRRKLRQPRLGLQAAQLPTLSTSLAYARFALIIFWRWTLTLRQISILATWRQRYHKPRLG